MSVSTLARRSVGVSLKDMADTESGPLAEAEALADVMEVLAVDKLELRDHSLPNLSHMLAERLKQVRAGVDALFTGGAA